MQIFFTKLRDLSLIRTRFSILCTEAPDEATLKLMFRLISDIAEIVMLDYNAEIEEESANGGNIFAESMPTPEANIEPYMVMYVTIKFEREDDKNLFVEDFIKFMAN